MIKPNKALCPEGSTLDGGVKGVNGGFDGGFGGDSMPKGMGSAMGRRTILFKVVLACVSRSGVATVMSPIVKAGPMQKWKGTSPTLMSVMQAKTLACQRRCILCTGAWGHCCCGQGGPRVRCQHWHW